MGGGGENIKASHDMELQFLTNQDRHYRKHCQYAKTVQSCDTTVTSTTAKIQVTSVNCKMCGS